MNLIKLSTVVMFIRLAATTRDLSAVSNRAGFTSHLFLQFQRSLMMNKSHKNNFFLICNDIPYLMHAVAFFHLNSHLTQGLMEFMNIEKVTRHIAGLRFNLLLEVILMLYLQLRSNYLKPIKFICRIYN